MFALFHEEAGSDLWLNLYEIVAVREWARRTIFLRSDRGFDVKESMEEIRAALMGIGVEFKTPTEAI